MPCPQGHQLEEKQVAGTSWFAASKMCSKCRVVLKAGMLRHSCKTCNYHLCTDCHASAKQDWLQAEIAITVYRAAGLGAGEDAWPVSVQRGASIGALRNHIATLYGLPPQMQIIRRDVDSNPLVDEDLLGCDEGDVLHLSVAGPGDIMMNPLGMLGLPPLDGLAEALTGALNEVAQVNEAMQQSLENTSYNLTFVLPEKAPVAEKRCRCEISAVARIEEVLDMVKLELDVEDLARGLEFAGEELPLHAPVHALGLRDNDLVMVLRREDVTSL